MDDIPKFTGFPKETLQFYADLKENNFREWFNERKDHYQEYVLKPAQSFVVAFGEKLKTISDGFTYDTQTNGRGSMMRIYRDIRFSKDKTPYNTRLRFRFGEGTREKGLYPGFFIGMDETGGHLLGGIHKFVKPTLDSFRKAVADDTSGSMLVKIIKAIRGQRGYKVGGENYKRVPRGYDEEHPRAGLLKYNALYVSSPEIPVSVLRKPDLVDVCYEHALKMAPVHNWLNQLSR
ncbi:MAG: DUF2461 domain-containing protein [Candidatus Thorarchaeota archaeon]|jgi:uncharacterized protein (TIGR02453 family)